MCTRKTVNDNQTKYKCCRCDNDAVTEHEPLFGTANKKICVKYNIKFPVCMDCHYWAHNKNKTGGAVENRNEEQALFFCELAGLKYSLLKIAFENSRRCTPLLFEIKAHMDGFLQKYER